MSRHGHWLLAAFFSLLLSNPCWAQPTLLIDPGTLSSVGLDDDDGVIRRNVPLTGTYRFFGDIKTTADVCVNGHLNFTLDQNFTNSPLPTSIVPRIAPLWDDFTMVSAPAGTDILDNQGDAGRPYYAATWKNVPIYQLPDVKHTFQVVWFGASVTVKGFDFLAGDIVFDYANLGSAFREEPDGEGATVGLDLGDGTNFAVLPGTTNGVIADTSLLPTDDDRFVLFRYNSQTNSYQVSIQAVPEPTVLLLLFATTALVGNAYCRRRHAARQRALAASATGASPGVRADVS